MLNEFQRSLMSTLHDVHFCRGSSVVLVVAAIPMSVSEPASVMVKCVPRYGLHGVMSLVPL